MRRGLGTSVDAEADRMVAELNEILGDPAWWSAANRQEASARFSAPVVAAFYDEIQAGREDPMKIRDKVISLPGKDDGYSRVMFIGTTGAGKTSLLRQIIGSDPDEDRFPSTAPAKTTISDIEVVQADGDFSAVVTFFTEFQVRASIEDCVADACMAVLDGAPDDKVAERFLSHKDQKFRLSYLLGAWKRASRAEVTVEEDDWSFDAGDGEPGLAEEDSIPEAEQLRNQELVESYLKRLRAITSKVSATLSGELGEEVSKLSGEDKNAALELFDEGLYSDRAFSDLVQDVLDEVRGRFAFVSSGNLTLCSSGWPESWTFNTDSRGGFIREIRWFSSNFWPQFGRLLTPLVQGIRVRGPLYPTFSDKVPKLVLIDGHGKLAIAFSHFDQIKGASLESQADRRNHVMASVINALSSLRDDLGAPVVNAMERSVDSRCFMFGGVDKALDKLPPMAVDYMKTEMGALLEFFASAIVPPPPPAAAPVYDPTGLAFAVREAASKFMGPGSAPARR